MTVVSAATRAAVAAATAAAVAAAVNHPCCDATGGGASGSASGGGDDDGIASILISEVLAAAASQHGEVRTISPFPLPLIDPRRERRIAARACVHAYLAGEDRESPTGRTRSVPPSTVKHGTRL